MRSVPHRVVCLLGLDDGAFPRKAPRDGDDLMLDDPHVGDRDARTEDRQLLLDALMAATDRLIITYTGNDERTNVARARRRCRWASCWTWSGRDVRRPASAAAVRPAQLRRGGWSRQPWSFDRVTLEGARGARRARAGPRAVPRRRRCRRASAARWSSTDLVRFVEHPVRAFLRQRLGISVGDYSDEVGDALPVELDELEQWGVGQRLLDARDGRRPTAARRSAPRSPRGTLPPGQLGMPVVHVDLAGRGRDRRAGAGADRGRGRVGGRQVDVRRPPAHGHGARRARRRAARRHVLAASTRATGSARGCGCWRCAPTGEAYAAATIGRGERRARAGDGGAGAGAVARGCARRSSRC